MSHYVAELIAAADRADDDDAAEAKVRAADEILKLWAHRSALPQPYPLESFDRIFAAIDRMESRPSSLWLRRYFGEAAPGEDDLAVVPLLRATTRLDDDVSEVVTLLIAEAALVASDSEATWLPIAAEIGEEAASHALRRLLSVTRMRRHEAESAYVLGDEIHLDGEVETEDGSGAEDASPTDSNLQEPDAAAEESGDQAEDDQADSARRRALIDALDRATETLQQLRAALSCE